MVIAYDVALPQPSNVTFYNLTDPLHLPDLVIAQPTFEGHALAAGPGRYFMGGDLALSWWDIADQRGTLVTNVARQSSCQALALADNLLYLGSSTPTLEVIDVTTHGEFQPVTQIPLPAVPRELQIHGGRLVALGATAPGLTVVSLTDPRKPVVTGSIDGPELYNQIVLQGDYAYVRTSFGGLDVIDLSDPAHPRRVGGNDHLIFGLTTDGRALYANAPNVLRIYPLYSHQPAYRALSSAVAHGRFGFQVRGIPGSSVAIERSDALGHWSPWKTMTFGSELMEVSDELPAGAGAGFYRLRPHQ